MSDVVLPYKLKGFAEHLICVIKLYESKSDNYRLKTTLCDNTLVQYQYEIDIHLVTSKIKNYLEFLKSAPPNTFASTVSHIIFVF